MSIYSEEQRKQISERMKRLKLQPSEAARRKGADWRRVRPHTPETLEKIARIRADQMKNGVGLAPTAGTGPELKMARILEETGIEYEWQHPFGRYVVDFWLPRSKEVVEVDGVYWHPNGPDCARDQYLLDRGVVEVHHITDLELGEIA